MRWAIMKENNPSLFGALLLSLFVRSLLQVQAAFWTRSGLLTLLPGILFQAAVGCLFARCWRVGSCLPLKVLFVWVLAISAAQDVLNLWGLYTEAYPDAVSLFGICLTVAVPVLYLRRVSALAQTANVVLGLLLAACALLWISLADRLAVTNLQTDVADAASMGRALAAHCTIYPELLLPALWPDSDKRGHNAVLRLAVFSGLFQTGMHLLLELFFGAAMPRAWNPVHRMARCGSLSIFDRLEWLQLIVWTMAVAVKLALCLYAGTRLLGGKGVNENNMNGLPAFTGIAAGFELFCLLLEQSDFTAAAEWLVPLGVWALVTLTAVTGGIRCLAKRLFFGRRAH